MREIALFRLSGAAGQPPALAAWLWQRAPALSAPVAVGLLLVIAACAAAPGGVSAYRVPAATAASLLPLLGMVWAARLQPRPTSPPLPDVGCFASLPAAPVVLLALALFAAHAAIGGLVTIEAVQAADLAALLVLFERGGPEAAAWTETISDAGGPLLPTLLPLLAVGMLCLLRQPRSFLFCWSTILAALAVPVIFKALFHRQRPYTGGREFNSYPSGHVTTATVIAGALLLVLLPRCRTPLQRAAVVLGAAAWPLLMAVSRMNLGCHYPADVMGGMLLGSAWVAGCLAAWIACCRLEAGRGREQEGAAR